MDAPVLAVGAGRLSTWQPHSKVRLANVEGLLADPPVFANACCVGRTPRNTSKLSGIQTCKADTVTQSLSAFDSPPNKAPGGSSQKSETL